MIQKSYEAVNNKEIPVACCFVNMNNKKLELVTIQHNLTNKLKNGTKHCEILCLDYCYKNNLDVTKMVAIVTVEPCLMCGYALLLSNIKKVYYVLPNSKFGGVESLYNLKDLRCEKISYKQNKI